jgi:hypothetical protein
VEEAFRVTDRGDTSLVEREVTPGDYVVGVTGQFGLGAAKGEPWDEVNTNQFIWGAFEGKFYNARLETIDSKPFWKQAWDEQRFAIIPSLQFKEGWGWYGLPDKSPLAMAAIYSDEWSEGGDEELVIITTAAVGKCAETHNRMPVLLTMDLWDIWMDPSFTSTRWQKVDLEFSTNTVANQLVRV